MEKIKKLDIEKVKALSSSKLSVSDNDKVSTPGLGTSRTARVLPLSECYIDINCDRPCYFPGDTVTAQVSIRSKKPIRGDFI